MYSWGLRHHTVQMWRAIDLVTGLVSPSGRLFIAIYNDQGPWSRYWARIKRFYNKRTCTGSRSSRCSSHIGCCGDSWWIC